MWVVRWARALSLAVLTFVALGCDGPDSQLVRLDERLDAGPSEAHVDGGGPGHGEGGPPGSSADGGLLHPRAFTIRGRLGDSPLDKRQKLGGDAAVERAVTHVMAVNGATANPTRYVEEVTADGTFALGVDLGAPWLLVLVDSRQVGVDMVAGVFRASELDLDSIAPTRPGSVELGALEVDATRAATAALPTEALLSSLGLSRDCARLLGALDDVSLRYVNPDVDGNGKIDALEGIRYPLDFHLRYTMATAQGPIALTALLGRFAPASSTVATYGLGSAIVSWDPDRFGITRAADFRIRFASSSGGYSAPPTLGGYTANQWIEEDSAFYRSAGADSVGISFNPTQPFPTGTYQFQIKQVVLTFTDVRTHALAALNENQHLVLPFLKLNPVEADCEGWSCAVTGFDYRWMKRAGDGWVPGSAEEIALLVPERGGFLSFSPSGAMEKRLEYVIPASPVSGTVAFSAPAHVQGDVSATEVADLTLDAICQLGVSYDDTLGMRIFQAYQQAPRCGF